MDRATLWGQDVFLRFLLLLFWHIEKKDKHCANHTDPDARKNKNTFLSMQSSFSIAELFLCILFETAGSTLVLWWHRERNWARRHSCLIGGSCCLCSLLTATPRRPSASVTSTSVPPTGKTQTSTTAACTTLTSTPARSPSWSVMLGCSPPIPLSPCPRKCSTGRQKRYECFFFLKKTTFTLGFLFQFAFLWGLCARVCVCVCVCVCVHIQATTSSWESLRTHTGPLAV